MRRCISDQIEPNHQRNVTQNKDEELCMLKQNSRAKNIETEQQQGEARENGADGKHSKLYKA